MAGAQALLTTVTWTEAGVGMVFYLMRVLTSVLYTKLFYLDFWFMLLTVVMQLVGQIFLQLSINEGMGAHTATVPLENSIAATHWVWVYQYLAIMATTWGKVTIIVFFLQLRRGTSKTTPWGFYILMGLLIAINMTTILLNLFQCDNYEKLWDPRLPGACPRALMSIRLGLFQGSFNCVADAILAVYPILLLRKLHMPLRTKIGLGVLMGFGWIAVLCSAIKAYEIEVLTHADDPMYDLHPLLLWASTESWIVIIVGCVPCSRPILEKCLNLMGMNNSFTGTNASPSASAGNSRFGRSGNNNGSRFGRSGNHGQYSGAHGSRNDPNGGGGGGDDDGAGWIELSRDKSNDSKEKIMGSNSVLVTTLIETSHGDGDSEFESRHGCHIPDPEYVVHGRTQDVRKIV